MENATADYRVWSEQSTIHFEGTMRLNGGDAYAPIQAILEAVLAEKPPLLTLDLTNLEFLNSSGINLLAKFTIQVRKELAVRILVLGSERIPWQGKSLANLKKLHSGLELVIS